MKKSLFTILAAILVILAVCFMFACKDDGNTDVTSTDENITTTDPKEDSTTTGGSETSSSEAETSTGDTVHKFEVQSFSLPSFYSKYLLVSNTATDTDADFRVKAAPYEVGTNNRFIFNPVVTAFDENFEDLYTFKAGVETIDSFFIKEGDNYIPFTEDQKKLVDVKNGHAYLFSDELIGKTVRMDMKVDDSYYYISEDISEDKLTISCEFVLVDGYNVYDQKGLSVMDDVVKSWTKLKTEWGTLEADDKPLVEYTDVTNIILHASFELDPNLFPEEYFWDKDRDKDTGYNTAIIELEKSTDVLKYQEKLAGSLRDFDTTTKNKAFFLDDGELRVNNMKGLYNTRKCSLSGNYNSITVVTEDSDKTTPEEYKEKYGTRNLYSLYSVGATQDTTSIDNPICHWAIFKVIKDFYNKFDTKEAFYDDGKFNVTIKNLSSSGSMGHVQIKEGMGEGRPCGLELLNCVVDELKLENVVADRFVSIVNLDDHGSISSKLAINDCRLLNVYNNMVYAWRANISVNRSIVKNAGGPLFLLVDGNRATTPGNPGMLVVDSESELSSLAGGTETWYKQYNAGSFIANFKQLDGLLAYNFGKTMQFTKDANDNPTPWNGTDTSATYIDMIALIIPDPDLIMTPFADAAPLVPEGSFKSLDANGDTVNFFDLAGQVKLAAKQFNTIAFQSGANVAFMGPQNSLLGATAAPIGDAEKTAWATTSTDYVCMYLSAGVTVGSANFPYFGVVARLNSLSK